MESFQNAVNELRALAGCHQPLVSQIRGGRPISLPVSQQQDEEEPWGADSI